MAGIGVVASSILNSPDKIPGLIGWWRADVGYNSSTGVWANSGSEVGQFGAPGGAGTIPSVGTDLAGRAALVFDGVNDRLQSEVGNSVTSFTMFFVSNILLSKGFDGNGAGWSVSFADPTTGKCSLVLTSTQYTSTSGIPTPGTSSVRGIRYDNITGASVLKIYANGVEASNDTFANADLRTSTTGWYFGNATNSLTNFFAGKLSEIALFNRNITDQENTLLYTNYFKIKYGL